MASCNSYEEAKLSIDRPLRGEMIPAGLPIEISITGKEDSLGEVLVDGIANVGVKSDDGKTINPPMVWDSFMLNALMILI